MATGAVLARILTQYSDKGSKAAIKDIARLTKKFDAFGKKAAKSFGIAITASAALAIKIGKDSVSAAIEDSKSQAVLAQAMMNTNGATKEAIASAEDYIKATMFRVNVADEELRKSLATLYYATGDLTQAERLQGIALDVAASQGKDLGTVTVAMTKAQQGNVEILKRLTPELAALIGKTTTAEEAFALLGAAYGGTAEQLANLDPLTKLRLAYGETLETLGYELLPVVKEFANYVVNDVIPAVDDWVKANGTELRSALEGGVKIFLTLIDVFSTVASFYNRFEWLIKLAAMFFLVGRAVKIAGRVFGGLTRALTGVRAGVKGFTDRLGKLLKGDEGIYKAAQAIGGLIEKVAKFALGMLGFGAAFAAATASVKSFFGMNEKTNESITKTTKKVYGGAAAEKYKAEVTAAAAKLIADARKKAAAQEAKDAAEAAKDAAYKAKVDSRILSIRKQLNISKDSAIDKETDLINLTAAANFLAKQGVIAKEEVAKLERLKEENFLLDARDTLLKRYADIQKALSDQKLDTKEIEELSKKWGISGAAVVAYVHIVKSVEDQVLSSEEIQTLADLWNISYSEAQKFLEVYRRIQDGLLDSGEVFDLIQKGFFKTEKEARIYADLVATVHDGIANDEDFAKVALKWELTKTKLNEYVTAMGAKFDYAGTFLDPITQLAIKWNAASTALQAYLDKLNSAKTFDYNKLIPPVIPGVTPGGKPIVPSPIVPGYGSSKDEKEEAAAAAAATTIATTVAEAIEAISTATTTETINAAVAAATEIGATASEIANSMVAGLLEQGVSTQNALSTARYTGQAIAAQQQAEQEAAERALRNQQYAAGMAARYGGYVGSTTMDNSKGLTGSGSGSATNITINVAGSVTTENDLVQTVRSGLLAGQYNGQSLILEPI
jgi:hypothetical protein